MARKVCPLSPEDLCSPLGFLHSGEYLLLQAINCILNSGAFIVSCCKYTIHFEECDSLTWVRHHRAAELYPLFGALKRFCQWAASCGYSVAEEWCPSSMMICFSSGHGFTIDRKCFNHFKKQSETVHPLLVHSPLDPVAELFIGVPTIPFIGKINIGGGRYSKHSSHTLLSPFFLSPH